MMCKSLKFLNYYIDWCATFIGVPIFDLTNIKLKKIIYKKLVFTVAKNRA